MFGQSLHGPFLERHVDSEVFACGIDLFTCYINGKGISSPFEKRRRNNKKYNLKSLNS